jgi:hypothetical protein
VPRDSGLPVDGRRVLLTFAETAAAHRGDCLDGNPWKSKIFIDFSYMKNWSNWMKLMLRTRF